jgi:hypothetical protein
LVTIGTVMAWSSTVQLHLAVNMPLHIAARDDITDRVLVTGNLTLIQYRVRTPAVVLNRCPSVGTVPPGT